MAKSCALCGCRVLLCISAVLGSEGDWAPLANMLLFSCVGPPLAEGLAELDESELLEGARSGACPALPMLCSALPMPGAWKPLDDNLDASCTSELPHIWSCVPTPRILAQRRMVIGDVHGLCGVIEGLQAYKFMSQKVRSRTYRSAKTGVGFSAPGWAAGRCCAGRSWQSTKLQACAVLRPQARGPWRPGCWSRA